MPLNSTKKDIKQPTLPKKASKPSILEEAKSAKDMELPENYKIKGLLAGPSGSGKRMSSTTLPGRLLLVDFDGRKETVAGMENIETLSCYDPDPKSPKGWMKSEELRKDIWASVRKGNLPYDGIIEATLTSMLRYCMNWSLLLDPKRGLGGSPAKQHYMPQMKNVSDHILSLKSLPLHYILTAHLEIIEDEEMGGLKYLPKATGKMRTEIPGWFNECYFCSREKDKNGKLRYYWTTAGTGRWDFLKSTLNQLNKHWSDPIEVNFNKSPVGFKRLLEMRFGKKKGGEKERKEEKKIERR